MSRGSFASQGSQLHFPFIVIDDDDDDLLGNPPATPIIHGMEFSQVHDETMNDDPITPNRDVQHQPDMNNIRDTTTPSKIVNPYQRNVSLSSADSTTMETVTRETNRQLCFDATTTTTTTRTSTTLGSGSKPVINPYLKTKKTNTNNQTVQGDRPFVGGAELARRNARQKMYKKSEPGSPAKDDLVLHPRMPVMERFFASLLRSSAKLFLEASQSPVQAILLWETICRRVNLEPVLSPMASAYTDPYQHFAVRAALVLEEARCAISQGLANKWRQAQNNDRRTKAWYLRAHYVEMIPASAHCKVMFVSSSHFTKEQLYVIRPGSLFTCIPRDAEQTIENALLGVVISSNRDVVDKEKRFQVLVCEPVAPSLEDVEWVVTPLVQLVTEQRCFEAMTTLKRVAFMSQLLGGKQRMHTRFAHSDDSNDDDDDDDSKIPTRGQQSPLQQQTQRQLRLDELFSSANNAAPMFQIPTLNETQEKAATSFLNAPCDTITLVQGPPGTGKTTLLVSIICRYVEKSLIESRQVSSDGINRRRRLLVSAPTNKAVALLATRFLKAMNPDQCPCSAILVGDADKLLTDSQHRGKESNCNKLLDPDDLSSILVFNWMAKITKEYERLKGYITPGNRSRGLSRSNLALMASRLEKHVLNGLKDLPDVTKQCMKNITNGFKHYEKGELPYDLGKSIEKLLGLFVGIPPDTIWSKLIENADVIFCTLASAGGALIKMTSRIDDLIVDEAAASTEPELCIPLHLQPSRLLAVGDPKQLPSTVLSRTAVEMGLSKSLHERLMNNCTFAHVMLDVQYRMNPEISSFPSMRFYQSGIADGENVSSRQYKNGPCLLSRQPYVLMQVDGFEEMDQSGSHRNHFEARAIVELICQLRKLKAANDPQWFSPDRIRVITFYQAQVALIRSLLNQGQLNGKVLVATVDSSQGCEADIVLVSFVRSPRRRTKIALTKHDAGFLTDDRRMNVALTRAKHQLICVGNFHCMNHMEGAQTLQMLIDNAQERNLIQTQNVPHQGVVEYLDLFYGSPTKKAKNEMHK